MPFTNPQAEQAVFNKDATVILQGCAVLPSNGVTTRAANIIHVPGADSWFIAVANMDIDPNSLGTVLQQPMSNVQVRLASNVARGDILNVANAIGEFQKAPIGAKNASFIALSAGVAGTNTTWAAPIGFTLSTISKVSTIVMGMTADPVTSSANFANITEMTSTLATSSGKLAIDFTTSLKLLPGDAGLISIFVDDVEILDSRRTVGATLPVAMQLDGIPVSTSTLVTLTGGLHVISAQWKATGGSLRAIGTQRSLRIVEV